MSGSGRSAGGSDAADGSDRSVPAPDVGSREWTRTRTSDATEPPPPVEVAVTEAAQVEAAQVEAGQPPATASPTSAPVSYGDAPKGDVRGSGGARRASLPAQGIGGALVGAVLVLAAWVGAPALLPVVLGLQLLLVVVLLSVLDAPAAGGAAGVAVAAAAVADVVVLVDDGRVDRVAGVLGISLVAALLHQLVRRGRSRVTESLADTMLAAGVAAGAACLLALAVLDGGRDVLVPALAAAAAALLVGRLVDRLLPRPVLAVGATRSWPGLLAGVLAGVGTALLAGSSATGLPLPAAGLLGLAAAVTVATADLAVDLGAAELRPGRRDARRAAALRPTAALLPYALLGPVVLLAGRLVLS